MSNDIAIRVEGLGKKYRLGHTVDLHRTFRETLMGLPADLARWTAAPFRKKPAPALADRASGSAAASAEDFAHPTRDSSEDFWALSDINFEIKQGESVGIIGRNGAGKSTLLKVLSRVVAPTTGRAEMRGRLASLLEVGTGFHPELTGRENVYLNGAILGMKRDEIDRRFDEIVDFAEVEQFLDTPVKRYSSGMYVRLAFAVAAHLEPEIMIVDEVLAVGDAGFQKKCLGKMGQVSQQGRTVLFVSHSMAAIQRFCSKAIRLDKGRVLEIGETFGVCERYLENTGYSKGVATQVFPDSGDWKIQFLSAELMNVQGESTANFRANEKMVVRITYEVKEDLNGSTVGLTFSDSLGLPLWSGGDIDFHHDLFETRKAGVWQSEFTVPGGVLRPGNYMIALGAAGTGEYYHHPSAFPVEILSEGCNRYTYKIFGVSGSPVCVPMEVSAPKPAAPPKA